MSKGLLLLDVDGPLNPYSGTNKPRLDAGYRRWKMRPSSWFGDDLVVWLNPSHGPALVDLAADADLDLVWCTTWEDDANGVLRHRIGLDRDLPVIHFNGHPGEKMHWKFSSVLAYAGDKPIAWLDDDFRLYADALAYFTDARGDIPTLLHTVSPKTGLVTEDFDAVRVWAASL